MGGYGITIGATQHFEITFMVNLTLDDPRFYFTLNLIKNRAKMVEDDKKLLELFMKELNSSWINILKQNAKEIAQSNWEILNTQANKLILDISRARENVAHDCYEITFKLCDDQENLLDSWWSGEGNKKSKAFLALFDKLDHSNKKGEN